MLLWSTMLQLWLMPQLSTMHLLSTIHLSLHTMHLSLLTMLLFLLMLLWLLTMVFMLDMLVPVKYPINLSPNHSRENTEAPHSPRHLELELPQLLILPTVFMVLEVSLDMDLVMELYSMVKMLQTF